MRTFLLTVLLALGSLAQPVIYPAGEWFPAAPAGPGTAPPGFPPNRPPTELWSSFAEARYGAGILSNQELDVFIRWDPQEGALYQIPYPGWANHSDAYLFAVPGTFGDPRQWWWTPYGTACSIEPILRFRKEIMQRRPKI